MIKTKQRDALFMYQPGNEGSGQYLAGLLKDGRLNVRFNFGAGDQLIDIRNSKCCHYCKPTGVRYLVTVTIPMVPVIKHLRYFITT